MFLLKKIDIWTVALLMILCSLVLCIPIVAFAFMGNYLPLTKKEMGKPFPLKHHGTMSSENIVHNISAGLTGIDVSVTNDGNIMLIWRDKQQKKWEVYIEARDSFRHYEVYTSDLDKNGITDLILLYPTGGNGLAPSMHLMTFMFDDMGRPVPFTAEGYFDYYDETGILDLVDLNGDGKSEL